MSLMQICRICLKQDVKLKTLTGSRLTLLEQLLGKVLKLGPKDNRLCFKCSQMLEKYTSFKNLCVNTELVWFKYYRTVSDQKFSNNIIKIIKRMNPQTKDYEICIVRVLKKSAGPTKTKRNTTVPSSDRTKYSTKSTEQSVGKIKLEKRAGELVTDNVDISQDKFSSEELDPLGDVSPKMEDTNHPTAAEKSCLTVKPLTDPVRVKVEGIFTDDSCDENQTDNESDGEANENTAEENIGQTYKKPYTKSEGVRIVLSLEEQLEELKKCREDQDFVNAKYKCLHCAIVFKKDTHLEKHMFLHLETNRHEVCVVCMKRFFTPMELKRHRRQHEYRVICQFCGQKLPTKDFADHLAEHKGTNHYPCDQCPQVFKKQISLTLHKVYKHTAEEKLLKCNSCTKTFKYEHQLILHQGAHSTDPDFCCKQCGKVSRNKLFFDKHMKMHEFHSDSYCKECNRHFKNKHILKSHYLKSSRHADPNNFRFKCDYCPKAFFSRRELFLHTENIHEGIKRFSCDMCPSGYTTKRRLLTHILSFHQGYKPPKIYDCEHCDKKFSTKKILSNHKRTHTGEQPFQCEICSRKFSQSSSLYTHKKLVHKILKK